MGAKRKADAEMKRLVELYSAMEEETISPSSDEARGGP